MDGKRQASPGAELEAALGVTGDWKADIEEKIASGEIHRYQGKANFVAPDVGEAFPACAKTIGDIRDQSNCGCWAFAGAEATSDRMCIATNATLQMPLSAQDVCFSRRSTAAAQPGLDAVIAHRAHRRRHQRPVPGSGPFGSSFCSDFTLPHCHHHSRRARPVPAEGDPGCPSGSPQCPVVRLVGGGLGVVQRRQVHLLGSDAVGVGKADIQQMIMEGGPIETAFTMYTDEDYAGGIYHHVSGGMAGGHAVKFVSWGVDGGVQVLGGGSWNPYRASRAASASSAATARAASSRASSAPPPTPPGRRRLVGAGISEQRAPRPGPAAPHESARRVHVNVTRLEVIPYL